MKRLKHDMESDSPSHDLPLVHFAREPRDAMEGYMQASALHQLLLGAVPPYQPAFPPAGQTRSAPAFRG